MPTTICAPNSRAARVGTGATRPPSARCRVPICIGSNRPGKAQLARIASARLPCLNTTGSPVPRSVATMAVGMIKILKLPGVEEALHQRTEAVVAGESKARNPPARKIAKANLAALFNNAGQGSAAGVSRAQNASNAASGYAGDGYLVFLENRSTPKWAYPRAKPPPSARPMPGRKLGSSASRSRE